MLELFRVFVEQPIFNLLEVIYAIVPGHDLGVAIIIFTAVIRILMWPLVKKQLNHTKKMRKVQPELKKLKKAAGSDRQKLARLQMEFYKEHEIKPFSTIGTLIIQIPIFIGLYQAVSKLIKDPGIIQTFSYGWVRDLPWIKEVAADPSKFDVTFLGFADLSLKGLDSGGIYIAAIVLAFFAAILQFYQSKQLMVIQADSRKLSEILKDATAGKQADQEEMMASVSKLMIYFMPFMTFIFSVSLPSALSLYLLTTSGVGYLQQRRILGEDLDEMTKIADEETVEVENVDPKPSAGHRTKKPSNPQRNKKKRRR